MAVIAEVQKPQSVLVATDFSAASETALHFSLALSRFYGSRFCLAHVVSSLALTIAGPNAIAVCKEAVSREAAELEELLIRSGALDGLPYKFVVRQGELWPELRDIIREEGADLLVVGTHGRHGAGKLFFGSAAEHIFRQATCPVLVFGPHSQHLPWVGSPLTDKTFLFATDFGRASLHGFPQAIAAAHQFGAKLAMLTIIPASPSSADEAEARGQENTRTRNMRRLAELAEKAGLETRPQLFVEFKSTKPVSEQILETADKLRADLIIMGLHSSAHAGIVSHLDLATAYDVVCQAGSPVLTVGCSSGTDLRARAIEAVAPPYSEAT